MRCLATLVAFLAAAPLVAQSLAVTPRGIAVAHDGRLELFDAGGQTLWSAAGVTHPGAMAADGTRVVVLDPLANAAVVADLATGTATRIATAETPVAAVFAGKDLYIVARDARLLQRAGGTSIPLPADPAFAAVSGGRVLVYARGAGAIEEIAGDRVVRRLAVPPFASDFEVAGGKGYLVYPRDARIRMFDLETMKPSGEIAVGAVPVDLTFAGGGSAITARILAVADPSAKRVWLTEETQSTAKAVGRGFLRGFLGLGLFSTRASQFPTGVDRVVVAGTTRAAFDSSSGTLYRFGRRGAETLAHGVAPGAFAVTDTAIVWWDGKRLQRR